MLMEHSVASASSGAPLCNPGAMDGLSLDSARLRAAVLVEGTSDQRAIEALAARLGRDLASEGVVVVPIGGASNVRTALEHLGRLERAIAVTGLCDAGEEADFRRGFLAGGPAIEPVGIHVCVEDLEDELVRALGVARVQRLIEDQGEARRFRTYRRQPAHRDEPLERQVHGFMWNRKVRYAPLLVGSLDPGQVPAPLAGVLASV